MAAKPSSNKPTNLGVVRGHKSESTGETANSLVGGVSLVP
jgi:hypothetical protein